MRITVEIDEKTLKKIKKHTKIAKHSPAIGFVIEDWLEQQRRNAFVKKVMSGGTDYTLSNDELERLLDGHSR